MLFENVAKKRKWEEQHVVVLGNHLPALSKVYVYIHSNLLDIKVLKQFV